MNNLLKNKIIEKSDSPYNNPLVLLRKKNGTLRMCVDFRELNAITKREMYPLPNASDLFDRLSGQQYFTTIDLSKGYYQIKLDKMSQEKTAFSTSQGHFKFTRLPFGLTSAPAAFQSAIETILAKEKYHNCAVYIDDIIIYGRTRKEHDYNLLVILNKLMNAGVKLSKEKFQFCKQKIRYLGHIISSKGIEKDPEKLVKLENWPRPKTMKELNSFLGFANYYRKFVRNFSQIASPLEKLVKKDKSSRQMKLVWSKEQESAFIQLKNSLNNAPLLHPANASDTFLLDVDASKVAIGGVLSQIDANGTEKPVYFASNKLSQAEQHYCATRRELLAVVKYVQFFHHYLVGKRFVIRTDHKSLTWLMKWKTPPSSQYFRWLSILQEYEFSIVHRDGKSHLNADALSRLPYCKQCKVEHVNAVNHDEMKNSISNEDLTKLVEKIHRQFSHIGANNLTAYLSGAYNNKNLVKICKNVCNRCIVCLKRKSIKSIQTNKGSLAAKETF
ncbi:MAG: reverse transcriptase domain-containing protein, partial [Bacteroidota bacterium]